MNDDSTRGSRGRGYRSRGHALCGSAGSTERRSHLAAMFCVYGIPFAEAVNLLSAGCALDGKIVGLNALAPSPTKGGEGVNFVRGDFPPLVPLSALRGDLGALGHSNQ